MTTETEYQNAVNYLTKLLNGGLMGERGSKPLRIAIEACELQISKQPISKSCMLRPNKISPQKPCPFCGAFLENQAPSVLWCHPQNGCLLSLRAIAGDDQIAQWDTRYGETAGKSNVNCEER